MEVRGNVKITKDVFFCETNMIDPCLTVQPHDLVIVTQVFPLSHNLSSKAAIAPYLKWCFWFCKDLYMCLTLCMVNSLIEVQCNNSQCIKLSTCVTLCRIRVLKALLPGRIPGERSKSTTDCPSLGAYLNAAAFLGVGSCKLHSLESREMNQAKEVQFIFNVLSTPFVLSW